MKKNNFFSNIWWGFCYPFVFLHLATKYFFAKKKLKKYIKRPEEFLDEEKYDTIYKLTKPISFLFKIKTVELFKEKKISKKPQLIVLNHRSVIDSLIVFKFLYEQLGTEFIFVAKKELENHKFGKLLKLIDTLFIDRNNLREAPNIINQQKEIIARKHKSLVVFIEGTRNTNKELLEFKSAALEVAYKTMCIIQPIVLYNTENYYENKKDKQANKEIFMEILKNIQPNAYLSINRQILSKNIQKEMQSVIDNYLNNLDK